ncbi:DinB family protein [Bacillus carboniphilus]|uniref:DinB family protein n=1 Tax=Bacillus carboniphilus TaxID=86663 RepID=A0ABN0WQ46_9BACI
MLTRPTPGEYNPYYKNYVNLVPDGDLLETLSDQINKTVKLVRTLNEKQCLFRYGPDKWSIKQVIGHVTDTERIMGYRMLCIARGETVALPGYDDQLYIQHASFESQSMEELTDHLVAVRQSTIQLIKSMDEDAWLRKGNANDDVISVRALGCIIIGHEIHHRNIVKERYLNSHNYPI